VQFTRILAAQLRQPELSLLPLPRPPMSPIRALQAGKFAESELGFQLFLSAGLRAFRSRVGEANALVAACADASVRIRLNSPFDASLSRDYTWALQPGDDIWAVGGSILSLLDDCHVTNVEVSEAVAHDSDAH